LRFCHRTSQQNPLESIGLQTAQVQQNFAAIRSSSQDLLQRVADLKDVFLVNLSSNRHASDFSGIRR
jgi:hypothetical protein